MKISAIVFLICGLGLAVRSQAAAGVSGSGVLLPAYRAFFHQVKDLEDASGRANGAEALELQNWNQKHIGLSSSEAAFVKQLALTHITAVSSVDQQAVQTLQAARGAAVTHAAIVKGTLPAPMPELAQLQKQRDSLTMTHIQSLQANLSPASFAKLDAWVKANFSQKIQVPRPAPPASAAPQGGVQ